MNKILGIFGLLVFIGLFTTLLSDSFDSPQNLYNVTRWSALYGVLSIGAAFVIITGGIDLSVGSLVCLVGCLMATYIMDYGWSIYFSIAAVMLISVLLGLIHGLMVTKLKMQPFVVTLGGFLIYRGFARWFCEDQPMGFRQAHDDGLRQLALGKPWIGFEHNLASLAGVGGVVLGIYLLTRLVWKWKDESAPKLPTATYAFFAIIVAFAGLSQFLAGPESHFVLKIAGYSVPITPRSVFYHLGGVLFAPLALLFLLTGLGSDFRRNLVPLGTLFLSATVFHYTADFIAPVYATLSPGGDVVRRLGWLSAQEGNLRIIILLIVFLSTAALISSIGWVVSTTPRNNQLGRALFDAYDDQRRDLADRYDAAGQHADPHALVDPDWLRSGGLRLPQPYDLWPLPVGAWPE